MKTSGVEVTSGIDESVPPKMIMFETYDELVIYYVENYKKAKYLYVGKLVHNNTPGSYAPKVEALNTDVIWKQAYELKSGEKKL